MFQLAKRKERKTKQNSFLVWSWRKYENDCSFYRIIYWIKFCTTSVFYRSELCFTQYLKLIKNMDESFKEVQRKFLFTMAETFKMTGFWVSHSWITWVETAENYQNNFYHKRAAQLVLKNGVYEGILRYIIWKWTKNQIM